jgi:hypothetical protein
MTFGHLSRPLQRGGENPAPRGLLTCVAAALTRIPEPGLEEPRRDVVQFKLSQANDYRARAKERRGLAAIAAEYLRENYLALAQIV